MKWLVVLLFICAASPAWGDEIFGLGGATMDTTGGHKSFSWQMEYSAALSDNFEVGFTYLNEGHIPENHRDGYGVQLRARTDLLDRRLTIAAGAGPYLYYNTTPGRILHTQANRHGLALMSSLAATWHFDNRMLLQLRVNNVTTSDSIDTFTTLLGIGYQLDGPRKPQTSPESSMQADASLKNELTLLFGGSNTFNSGEANSYSAAVELRRRLLRYLEWSAMLLYEGENDLIKRKGAVTQLWASKSFFNERFSLGVGAGPYLAFDSAKRGRDVYILPIVTMSTSYRFQPQWGARFSWSRVITDYDRDSDIWLIGMSYLF